MNFQQMRKALSFSVHNFRETFGEIRRDPEHIYQQISKGKLNPVGLNIGSRYSLMKWQRCLITLPEKTLFVDMETNQA